MISQLKKLHDDYLNMVRNFVNLTTASHIAEITPKAVSAYLKRDVKPQDKIEILIPKGITHWFQIKVNNHIIGSINIMQTKDEIASCFLPTDETIPSFWEKSPMPGYFNKLNFHIKPNHHENSESARYQTPG